MKLLISALLLLSSQLALSQVVVLALKNTRGEDVMITAERRPTVDGQLVTFAKIRAQQGSRSMRIDNQSSGILLRELCRSYAKHYPHTYNTVETKSMLEKVVRIEPNLNVGPSNGNLVMRHAYCQKEPY
jgi:hypothetical protein